MSQLSRRHALVLALGIAVYGGAAQAGVAELDEVQLVEALKAQPQCCVVDARSEANRRKHPLEDALPYRTDLSITPTAAVVVVADRDQDAKAISQALAKKHPGKDIYAVKGGVMAWQSALKKLSASSSSQAPGAPTGFNFVIPRNTCESGTPLQILQSKPKP